MASTAPPVASPGQDARKRISVDPDARRLVLAYPVHSLATSPPLGVCQLKGYVQRALPDWTVKVLDLNLEAHEDLFERIRQKATLPISEFPPGTLGEIALSRAAETFRGAHPHEFYDRMDRYLVYTELWQRYVRSAIVRLERLQEGFRGGPMPALIERQAELVLHEKPSVVGISICYTQQLWAAMCLAKVLKQRSDVPIVLGGTFFNGGVEEHWAGHRHFVDYVVVGSGERPLVEILSGRARSNPVPGVATLQQDKVVQTPPVFDDDLDFAGDPDFSDLDLKRYYSPEPVLPLITSRGCYWHRCSFCSHFQSVGHSYQQRSIEALVTQLREHVARGIRHFSLVDDIIAPGRYARLSEAILDAGLDIRYSAMAKPVKQFDRELLQRMYQSGCRFIAWGLESGSQRILDLMDKGTNVDDIERVLATAHEVGIRNHVFIMCGFPTETRQEFQSTLDLLERHRAHISGVYRGMFELEAQAPIFKNPEKFSISRIRPKTTALLYDFDCATGMSRQQARQALTDAGPFLRSFSPASSQTWDFRFRDHVLLMYGRDAEVYS